MNRIDFAEDAGFFLYLSPFIVSGVYGLFLWVKEGLASSPSLTLFLTVTKDPLTFLIGVIGVCGAIIIDLGLASPENRRTSLLVNSRRLQFVAVISLLLSAVFAWVASGYSTSFFRVFAVFLSGRYSIVFPLFLFTVSLFITFPRNVISASGKTAIEGVGLALLIISPLSLFALSRLKYPLASALAVSFIAFAVGLAVMLYALLKRPISR